MSEVGKVVSLFIRIDGLLLVEFARIFLAKYAHELD